MSLQNLKLDTTALSLSLSLFSLLFSLSLHCHHDTNERSYTFTGLPRGPNIGLFQSLDLELIVEYKCNKVSSVQTLGAAALVRAIGSYVASRRVPYFAEELVPTPEVVGWLSVRVRPKLERGTAIASNRRSSSSLIWSL